LDKELMIGHMQGKFQLVVVPGVGHMLHEVSFAHAHSSDIAAFTQSCYHRRTIRRG
jgi:hypothetical protein